MLPLSPFYKWGYWGTEFLNSNPTKVTHLGCKVLIWIWTICLQSPRSWLLSTLPLKFDVNTELMTPILECCSFFEIKVFHGLYTCLRKAKWKALPKVSVFHWLHLLRLPPWSEMMLSFDGKWDVVSLSQESLYYTGL